MDRGQSDLLAPTIITCLNLDYLVTQHTHTQTQLNRRHQNIIFNEELNKSVFHFTMMLKHYYYQLFLRVSEKTNQ